MEQNKERRGGIRVWKTSPKLPCASPRLSVHSRHFPAISLFAVVSIAGFQEKVSQGDTLVVPLQDAEKDKKIVFENVLMVVKDGGEMVLGSPFVKGATVEVKVLEHGRDKKIRVVKMRRRKRHTRVHGHKQRNTKIEVTKITV